MWDRLVKFYELNKFYSWLFGISILIIIILDIVIIIHNKYPNYLLIGKIWVIASSILTAIYTYWFWYSSSAKGIEILDQIIDDKPMRKTKTILHIFSAIFLLVVIAIINGITFNNNQAIFNWVSILLMVLTFYLFSLIDNLIIQYHRDPKVKKDFVYALNNSDIPGVISFSFLAIYFLFLYFLTKHSMELFFSGAIAFQILYSSFVWANTELTDAEQN